jgi:hypothetical protein
MERLKMHFGIGKTKRKKPATSPTLQELPLFSMPQK